MFSDSPLDQPHALDGLVVGADASHAQPPHPEAQPTLVEVEALVRVDRIEHLKLSFVNFTLELKIKFKAYLLSLRHVGHVALAGEGGVDVVNVVLGVLLIPL